MRCDSIFLGYWDGDTIMWLLISSSSVKGTTGMQVLTTIRNVGDFFIFLIIDIGKKKKGLPKATVTQPGSMPEGSESSNNA